VCGKAARTVLGGGRAVKRTSLPLRVRIKRREFITLLGSTAAWPLAAHAQRSPMPVVGVLSGGSSDYPAFTKGLAESGYQNGRNVRIEFVSGHYDQTVGNQLSPPGVRGSRTRRHFLKSTVGVITAGIGMGLSEKGLTQIADGADADSELARLRGQRRILLRGGVVLTLDRQIGDFAQADVLIENGKIREIRPNIFVSDDSTGLIDATNRIVMPGFVDTHHHFYQGILRNILPNGRLDPDYRRNIANALTPAYQPADVYAGALITALSLIEMGTTTAIDTSQCSHTPEHTDAGIGALEESGIRAVYAFWEGNGPGAQYPTDAMRLRRTYFSSQDQLMTLALASVLDPKAFAYARQTGLRIVTHGVDAKREQRLHDLNSAGLLRPGDLYIHCNDLSDKAWKVIRDNEGKVSLAPPIEMTMGHGMPGIQDALDHGIRPSLSSDVDALMAQDLFSIMRATFTLQRLNVFLREYRGEKALPPLLRSRDVLEFATIEGSRAAQLESKVGSLVPGKEADIILLRTDSLSTWPLNNAAGAVVNLMNPSHVDTVFIAGKIKKWRGALVGVDKTRVLRLAEEARDAVVRRANFQINISE
jgi:5-methylthioadenosine/S-adenosylhomocysteine deaminase